MAQTVHRETLQEDSNMRAPTFARTRDWLPARKSQPRTERVTKGAGPSAYAIALFLIKVAKHMALLACFLIGGSATGRATIGQMEILLLVIIAAIIHSLGRCLERRVPASLVRLPRPNP